MYIRISVAYEDKTIKTVDIHILHLIYDENMLSFYDLNYCVFDIPISEINFFRILDLEEAGIDYKCYNDIELAFKELGFKEVNVDESA